MSDLRMERVVGVFSPTATGTTNLAQLAPTRMAAGLTEGKVRIIDMTCFVARAANGTGTVSFGRTTPGVASLMSTANVGAGTTGRKTTAGGADLTTAGLGTVVTPGAADEFITGTYTIGTDTVTPIIRYCALVVRETDVDKLRAQVA